MSKIEKHKSSIGDLDANIVCLIAYWGGTIIGLIPGLKFFSWLVPIVIYFLEKKSSFAKKHSLQAITLLLASAVLSLVFFILAELTWPGGLYGLCVFVMWIVSIAMFVCAIIASVKAYHYEEYEFPYFGKYASNVATILDKIVSKSTVETTTVTTQKAEETKTEEPKAESTNSEEK